MEAELCLSKYKNINIGTKAFENYEFNLMIKSVISSIVLQLRSLCTLPTQREKDEAIIMSDPMSIPEFYSGRSVLITGGTGFMGKVLIEKLLRSCSNLSKIYILVRPKKNIGIERRIKDITLEKVTHFNIEI